MDIRSRQKRAWADKPGKGFSTTDVPPEFCLLQGEIAEAFDACCNPISASRASVAVEAARSGGSAATRFSA
jgi:hypothetical protein